MDNSWGKKKNLIDKYNIKNIHGVGKFDLNTVLFAACGSLKTKMSNIYFFRMDLGSGSKCGYD